MKTKNIKSKQSSGTSENFKDVTYKSFVHACPHCGNQEMNYYVSAQGVWKCSKSHLHGNFESMVSTLKSTA